LVFHPRARGRYVNQDNWRCCQKVSPSRAWKILYIYIIPLGA